MTSYNEWGVKRKQTPQDLLVDLERETQSLKTFEQLFEEFKKDLNECDPKDLHQISSLRVDIRNCYGAILHMKENISDIKERLKDYGYKF